MEVNVYNLRLEACGKINGSLDGIEADTSENLYYVTDWAEGKVYAVNSDGTKARNCRFGVYHI
jgi:sugar lactone lactonase YvrE